MYVPMYADGLILRKGWILPSKRDVSQQCPLREVSYQLTVKKASWLSDKPS